jgi:hypothetical protein
LHSIRSRLSLQLAFFTLLSHFFFRSNAFNPVELPTVSIGSFFSPAFSFFPLLNPVSGLAAHPFHQIDPDLFAPLSIGILLILSFDFPVFVWKRMLQQLSQSIEKLFLFARISSTFDSLIRLCAIVFKTAVSGFCNLFICNQSLRSAILSNSFC